MYIRRNISIITVFKDKVNLYNMYKMKLHKTSKCLWPVYTDLLVVKWVGFFSNVFVNHFPKIHRSVLRKITIDLLFFWDVYDVSLGRRTDYSSRRNVFIWFRHFKEKGDSNTGVFLWNLWNFQEQKWLLLKTRNIIM